MGVDVGVRALDLARLDASGAIEHRRIAPDAFGAVLDEWRPDVVGIDAPSGWAASGKSRACERDLMRAGIHCYFTPTEAGAAGRSFYDWMRVGLTAYRACVASGFAIATAAPAAGRSVIEVFPHATTRALLGGPYPARRKADKGVARRRALAVAGIETWTSSSLDAIDAALCAVTARAAHCGDVDVYADSDGGAIYVPFSRSSAAR